MIYLYYTTLTLFVICCLLMMMLVLIQKGRGGGLAGAFGGGGGHTPFGTKTGDVLTWTTAILFGIFIILAISLNWVTNATQKPVPTTTVKIGQARVIVADDLTMKNA